MADSEDSSELFGKIFSVPSSQQGTREEQSVGQVSLVEKNIGEVIRTITSNIDIFGTSQISESQVNITQANRTKVNIPQCSLSQVSSIQNGISQISSSQIGSDQIGISQIGASQITVPNFSDRSSSQISFSEVKIVQTQVTQVESDQIGSGEIRLTTGNKNLNLSEGRSESVVNIFPIFHLSDAPQILSSLQSTTIDIWSDLLKAKTSLNFTFNITNLPSGQLAEGTITSYNTNGRPNTATISIDDDANGVGWFIDSTPQDNSEFTGVDNYLQATPNSAASGKYDLLTALLHEMGHTLGIINGYSEFDKYVKNGIFTTDTLTTKLTPDRQIANPSTGSGQRLIYNWYINGATTPVVGQTIDYTFPNNGICPVKLDVIDTDGAITTLLVNVTVNNVAPTRSSASSNRRLLKKVNR